MDEEIIDPDFIKITEGTIFKKTLRDIEDKIVEESIGMMVTIEVMKGPENGKFQEIIAIIGIEVQVIVDQDWNPELVPIDTE